MLPKVPRRQYLTSTCPLLAQRKQTTLGVIGREVKIPKPPISHTFSASQSSCGEREIIHESFTVTQLWNENKGKNGKMRMPAAAQNTACNELKNDCRSKIFHLRYKLLKGSPIYWFNSC